MISDFIGNKTITTLTLITLVISFGAALTVSGEASSQLPTVAWAFMLFWLSISIIFCFLSYREFTIGFLFSIFTMFIGWRIGAIYSIHTVTYPLILAFIFMLANFIYCVHSNLTYPERYIHKLSMGEWQLVFIRLYIGLDFVPHFTEKLFAGLGPRMADVNAFTSLGVPDPTFFVWLAGLCEFGAAVALALGFLMRLGSFGAVLYLLIATYLGHHFNLGFIWAGQGGGWEFATLWMVLIFSFAITGFHKFSVDQRLEDKFNLPKWLKKLM
jgi:putative oxidoreductase